MKLITQLIKMVFVPFIVLLFICIGFLCAFISGYIEFSVLKDIFSSVAQQSSSQTIFVFLLVVILESAKFSLQLFDKRIRNKNGPFVPAQFKKTVRWTKYTLIIFSFVCTIMFTTNSLYLANYDSTKAQTKIQTIESNYQAQIDGLDVKYSNQYASETKIYQDTATQAKLAYNDFEVPLYDGDEVYQRAVTQKEALRQSFESSLNSYNTFIADIESKKNAEKQSLINDKNTAISNINNFGNVLTARQYDNTTISSFLNFVTNTFAGVTYSQGAYATIVLLISLMISFATEAIITISNFLLTADEEVLNSLNNNYQIDKHLQEKSDHLIAIIFNSTLSIFAFIVIIMFPADQFTLSPEQMFYAFISTILAIFGSDLLNQNFTKSEQKLRKQKNYTLFTEIRTSLVQGAIAFTGYAMIGFFFGNIPINENPVSIALGLGATLARAIGFVPFFIFQKDLTE